MKPMLVSDVGWCIAMKDVFTACGLDAEALLAKAGFNFSGTDQVDVTELTDAFSRAWELAVAQTGNPAIGLTAPSHPLKSLGVLSHMVLSAPDLRGAMQAIVRFTHLISPTATFDAKLDGGSCFLILEIAPGRNPVPSQRYDFYSTVLLQAARWITGRHLTPRAFYHPAPTPADPTPWHEAYGCPVHFGSSKCMLELSSADLSLPIPTADPRVADLCDRLATQVAEQQGGSVSIRVRQALQKIIAKGEPRRQTVATMLCISERTLQRRLTEEGTSFAELVDEVRRELAQRYFKHSTISSTEITFALGFADPSNFYRACKRWFGRSPSTMR